MGRFPEQGQPPWAGRPYTFTVRSLLTLCAACGRSRRPAHRLAPRLERRHVGEGRLRALPTQPHSVPLTHTPPTWAPDGPAAASAAWTSEGRSFPRGTGRRAQGPGYSIDGSILHLRPPLHGRQGLPRQAQGWPGGLLSTAPSPAPAMAPAFPPGAQGEGQTQRHSTQSSPSTTARPPVDGASTALSHSRQTPRTSCRQASYPWSTVRATQVPGSHLFVHNHPKPCTDISSTPAVYQDL